MPDGTVIGIAYDAAPCDVTENSPPNDILGCCEIAGKLNINKDKAVEAIEKPQPNLILLFFIGISLEIFKISGC